MACRRTPYVALRILGSLPLRTLSLFAAFLFGAMVIFVAIPRVLYPYDLEFIEDGILMQALRVANGQPVYLPPNADFVPHAYTPLYAWLGGQLFRLTGPGFAPLRLLSLAATLATAALIFRIAQRESGLRWIAIACAGLWLGGYRISGGWYDLARVDALFVALTLGGVASVVYLNPSSVGPIGAGLLLGLAFLTKQYGLFFAAGAGCYFFLTASRRRAWLFVLVFAAVAAIPSLLLEASTAGWFSAYVFGIARASPYEALRAINTIRFDLFGSMAALTLGWIFLAARLLRRRSRRLTLERPWPLFTAAAVTVTIFGRAAVGGHLDHLMPAYAFLCLTPALLIHEATGREWGIRLVSLAILAQFALGVYDPFRFVPTDAMRAAGDRLIARIQSIEGEVMVMMHPYYAALAGKAPSAQLIALWHARWRGRDPLPPDFVQRIENQYYAAIISDESEYFETEPALVELIEANYVRGEELTESDAPSTLSGVVTRPREVYVPRE